MGREKIRKISHRELKVILREHRLWVESKGIEGKRINLPWANIPWTDLSGVNLEGAILSEANLELTNLSGANLSGANLEKTYLERASLIKANLSWTNLSRAILSGANLSGANLVKAELIETNLERANLSGANLSGASLPGANLEEGDLRDADLSDTWLVSSNLSHIKTAGAVFKGANLSRIQIDKDTASLLPPEIVNLYGKTFFILGYSDDLNKIIRSIEFPPEYHQAGISILNFFSTILKKKYPNKSAKVRIEQEDNKVTMIIEPEEGDREIIEKALDEYGLIVTGQMEPEQFTDNRQLLLELKTELRVAQVRIEAQKDIIEYHRSDLAGLHRLLDTGLRHPPPIQNIINVKIAPQINLIQGSLNELKEQLPQGSDEAKSVDELQQSLEHIEKTNSPGDVAKSSDMSKFRRFINDLGDENSNLGKTIRGIKKGTDIARDLAGSYNKIAQWCGLPQVPEPFVKKKIG